MQTQRAAMSACDSVLVLGFGGPEPDCCERRPACPRTPGCEAECFVSGILGDDPARAARVAEVAARYAALGGSSPYNAATRTQVAALHAQLGAVPLALGFRRWQPWPAAAAAALAAQGARAPVLLALAPHPSVLGPYREAAATACAGTGLAAPRGLPAWHTHPGFIAALADRIRATVAAWPDGRFAAAALVLTAHSIPAAHAGAYPEEVAATAAAVAAACGHPAHTVAWQSAPPGGRGWIGPQLDAVLPALARDHREVVVASVGFLVDHLEVLWDLDHEARQQADGLGLGFHRAATVHDHPAFIAALAGLVGDALG
jgi:ferrochelatase